MVEDEEPGFSAQLITSVFDGKKLDGSNNRDLFWREDDAA
jgi:hypothetical protein